MRASRRTRLVHVVAVAAMATLSALALRSAPPSSIRPAAHIAAVSTPDHQGPAVVVSDSGPRELIGTRRDAGPRRVAPLGWIAAIGVALVQLARLRRVASGTRRRTPRAWTRPRLRAPPSLRFT